jgi:hypothetical protein
MTLNILIIKSKESVGNNMRLIIAFLISIIFIISFILIYYSYPLTLNEQFRLFVT